MSLLLVAAVTGDVEVTLFISPYNGDGVTLHLSCRTLIMVYMSSVET